MTRFDAAVCIGRFQPPHRGHLALIEQALSLAPWVVVVLGSAYQARTPKNPFNWQERAGMIREALPEAQRSRLLFLPMRDLYDEPRWAASVRDGVARLLAEAGAAASPAVALVGHFKDPSSDYLHAFPQWPIQRLARFDAPDGTAVRDAFFSATGLDGIAQSLPPSTWAFLREWARRPEFVAVAEEWRQLHDYRAAWAAAPYPPVFVTVDAVVTCAGRVLLIQRGQSPGKGLFALPGGFIEQRETVARSTLRELQEETALAVPEQALQQALRGTTVFDHPDRSQRGRTITHASYFALDAAEPPAVQAGDDAAAAGWLPIAELAAMEDRFHDDHFHILDHFLGLTS